MKFLLSTFNENKLNEFKKILHPIGINIVSIKDKNLSMSSPEENGNTFEENAFIKAKKAYDLSKMPSIGDDSGLQVDALGGAPGIYSARYAGKSASNIDRINKLLKELKDVPEDKRTARFVCSICCIISLEKKIIVTGTCNGKIAFKPIGNYGFGYDPIFICENGLTFAQLSSNEKNRISHRGVAIRKLHKELENLIKGE